MTTPQDVLYRLNCRIGEVIDILSCKVGEDDYINVTDEVIEVSKKVDELSKKINGIEDKMDLIIKLLSK